MDSFARLEYVPRGDARRAIGLLRVFFIGSWSDASQNNVSLICSLNELAFDVSEWRSLGMGSDKRKKNIAKTIRFSDEESFLLSASSEESGLTEAEFVRRCIRGALIPSALNKKVIESLFRAFDAHRKYGTNLNTLVRYLNSGSYSHNGLAEKLRNESSANDEILNTLKKLVELLDDRKH